MNDNLDDLASGDLPEVKQNAIDAIQSVNEEKLEKAVKVDGFNPDIHVTDDSGKPEYTKAGKLKKKRGRKKGATNSTLNLDNKKDDEKDPFTMSSMDAATTISGILEMAQYRLISEEFIYNEIERTGNIAAWATTLDYYGGVSLTPPQALALSHLQIILSRAMSEKSKTRAKFGLGLAWFKNKMTKFKFKGKNKNGAHVDSGEDPKRENNTGDKDSGKDEVKGD